MLTLRAIENEGLDMDKQDEITLEQIRDADEHADIPAGPAKRGRKKKQQAVDDDLAHHVSFSCQSQCCVIYFLIIEGSSS